MLTFQSDKATDTLLQKDDVYNIVTTAHCTPRRKQFNITINDKTGSGASPLNVAGSLLSV